MLSKADVKYINSLQNKKYRKTECAFFVEGYKNVLELLESDYEVLSIYCSEKYEQSIMQATLQKGLKVIVVKESELKALGTLETNNSALAVAKIKVENTEPNITTGLTLALDQINDPGNFGTIIRIADWYGIQNVICSPDTVDLYNPKVINATKGSFIRVNVLYTDLPAFFSMHSNVPLMAAVMDGNSVYTVKKKAPLILLLGNEANGIRPELMEKITQKITIPRRGKSESLNVGVAAGILIDRLLE